jgi:hypothetical protein
VIACAPAVVNLAWQVAVPLVSTTAVQTGTPLSFNVTVPEAAAGATVAVSVTGWPSKAVGTEVAPVVVVIAGAGP